MTAKKPRKLLVTSALPYANGPLHLGHIFEFIQTDIWVRFQRLNGNECYYVGGDDAHGTPIMIRAAQENKPVEEWIAENHQTHLQDLNGFNISIDNFYTTHSSENKQLASEIYQRLYANGDIKSKVISQAYDTVKNMFLPDRYVKGDCPRCGAVDQYGDSCENCGATYSTAELKNARSTLSGETPIQKDSEHLFFQLNHYEQQLRQWFTQNTVQEQIINKLDEWFESGLQAWDISRDAPYFGFEIPNAPGKFFYVWLDAPIGYMASFKNLCDKSTTINFDEFWNPDSQTELYHFIGKDVVYFHALFWPAMLMGANYRTPTAIITHGFVTVDGQKMSKSRGTFITAKQYLEHLNEEYLRYYFATKLTNTIQDIDLNFEDFKNRINSDLVGKVVNIASRCASFIHKNFSGKLANSLAEPELFNKFITAAPSINLYYEEREFSKAMREIMSLADLANQYIDEKKPWALNKLSDAQMEVQMICTMGLNLFKLLIHFLKPVLPSLAEKSEAFLNIAPLNWNNYTQPLVDVTINPFTPLLQRIEQDSISQLLAI